MSLDGCSLCRQLLCVTLIHCDGFCYIDWFDWLLVDYHKANNTTWLDISESVSVTLWCWQFTYAVVLKLLFKKFIVQALELGCFIVVHAAMQSSVLIIIKTRNISEGLPKHDFLPAISLHTQLSVAPQLQIVSLAASILNEDVLQGCISFEQ